MTATRSHPRGDTPLGARMSSLLCAKEALCRILVHPCLRQISRCLQQNVPNVVERNHHAYFVMPRASSGQGGLKISFGKHLHHLGFSSVDLKYSRILMSGTACSGRKPVSGKFYVRSYSFYMQNLQLSAANTCKWQLYVRSFPPAYRISPVLLIIPGIIPHCPFFPPAYRSSTSP
jgi:hypothetical protein